MSTIAGVCAATTRLTMSPFDKERPDTVCMRAVDDQGRHKGQHQGITHQPEMTTTLLGRQHHVAAYDRLVTWSEGGASSHKYDPDVPNENCMCRNDRAGLRLGHRPEDHRWARCEDCGIIFDTTGAPICLNCGYWNERVAKYGLVMPKGERFVRPHDDTLSRGETAWLYVWSPGHGGAFGGRRFTVTFDDGTVVGPADFLWANGRIPWWLVDKFPPNARVEDTREHQLRAGWLDSAGKPLPYTGHPSL